MSRISRKEPVLLLATPKPELETRRFHEKEVPVWIGDVATSSIKGWIGNPRTELFAEQFMRQFGRDPTDEEMYELVINDDDPKEGLKIRELAGNIYRNGVRVPVVLTFEGTLLDGNRRYYSCMFLTKEGAGAKHRDQFTRLPAMVLPEGIDQKTKDAIITEFNFIDDGFIEWPYFVKATKVYEDFVENAIGKEELKEKYGLPWPQLRTWIKARTLCEQFLNHYEMDVLAKQFAYRNFIMFDEMARRYIRRFEETEFSEAIFDILLDGYSDDLHRFRSSQDVIRLRDIRDNPEAWDALTERKGKEALKDALRVLEVATFDRTAGTNKRLGRIVNNLDKLITSGSLNSANDDLLEDFHEIAEQIPGAPIVPAARVEKMIDWLDEFTAKQISELEVGTLDMLRAALERVLAMAEAASNIEKK